MFVKSWSFRAALCLALFLRIEAKSAVENNAYQNVLVSFSSTLSPENGKHFIESMQKILNDASSVLHTAIGLKIGSVTFHLPRTWNSLALEGVNLNYFSSYKASVEPDIQVKSLTDSAFGDQPVALQYGGCGVPGLELTIPNEFLSTDEETFPKGKILAREWLKYRYGVFDEHGFLDDPMYPTHYSISGSDDIHITDCTHPKLGYSIRDSENNSCVLTSETASNCSILPNEDEVENVKSSLMFYHEKLPQLDHICGKEERIHNVGSPSKQNLLCSYKIIWEVLQFSDDFKSTQESDVNENVEIEYTFVQESELRLVVAWQDTINLLKQKDAVLNVVRKLMFDIPAHSKVALYSFKGDQLKTAVPFAEITEDIRKSWLPGSNFGNTEEGKPLIALEEAVNVLQTDEKDKPGMIVLLTVSNPAENAELVEKLRNSKLCLTVIGFPGATEEGWIKFLEVSECSSFVKMPDSNDDLVETYKNLYSSIEPIVPLDTEDSKKNTVSTAMLAHDKDLVIPADPRAKTYTVWIFHDVEFECFVNEIAITHNKETTSSSLISYSFEAHNDTVICRMKDIAEGSFLVHVQMFAKTGEYLNNKVWFQDTTPSDTLHQDQNTTKQMPYIIYAKIFYGEYPVRDADVQAKVITPEGKSVDLKLVDDGRGDPDITQNDGIYSKYFTQFDSEGDYRVIITVTDNNRAAKASRNGQNLCCGSAVVSESFEVSEFNWTHETSFKALSKPQDGYKPSRVTDLKIQTLKLPNSLLLKWTAPGGEMDEGKASRYEFLMFCQHPDCHEDGILPNWTRISNVLKPKEHGAKEAASVQFLQNKPENITIYLVLKAFNKNKLFGEASNRIYIKLAQNNLQETTTPKVTEDKPKESFGPTAGSIVAYVIISIAILMLICGIIYFLLDRTKRSAALEHLNTPAAFKSVDSSGDIFSFKNVMQPDENPIRRAESIPVVLYTHDQIKDFKDKTKQPHLYRSDAPPKPWASLNALIDGNGSSSSNSTMNVADGKTQSSEMRQLDDVSFTTVPLNEKNSRF